MTTLRAPPLPSVRSVVSNGGPASSTSDSLQCPSGITPLEPQSQLPRRFSVSGTAPLQLPRSDDEAIFRQFMMNSIVALHSEIAGIKMMTNNLYNACYPLIGQSANKATATLQENSYKNRLETIDAIDTSQVLTVLATDIEREIHKAADKADAADLRTLFKRRKNKAKARWLLEVVLHRRMISCLENRLAAERTIIERLNQYAARRRRAFEKAEQACCIFVVLLLLFLCILPDLQYPKNPIAVGTLPDLQYPKSGTR